MFPLCAPDTPSPLLTTQYPEHSTELPYHFMKPRTPSFSCSKHGLSHSRCPTAASKPTTRHHVPRPFSNIWFYGLCAGSASNVARKAHFPCAFVPVRVRLADEGPWIGWQVRPARHNFKPARGCCFLSGPAPARASMVSTRSERGDGSPRIHFPLQLLAFTHSLPLDTRPNPKV